MMLALALMVTAVAFTQRPERPQPNPELRKEMQNYIEKNVVPVLEKAQNEFDSKLSAEDLKFIQAKRIEVAQIREEKNAKRKEMMEKRKAEAPSKEERKAMREKLKNMSEEERKAFREERMAKHEEMRQQFKAEHGATKKEVKAFMQRNEALIKSSMVSLKPNYKKWIADQKAILEKYHPTDAPKMRHGKHKGHLGLFGIKPHHGKEKKGMRGKHGKKGKHKGERKGKDGKKKGTRIAAAFVLWDGTVPTPPAESTNSTIDNFPTTENAKVLLGQNYPNPATGITRIEIDIPEGISEMTLTVTDLNGKVAQRLNFSNLIAGKETIELDVNSLSDGQYFYTIEYNGLKESRKMTVQNN